MQDECRKQDAATRPDAFQLRRLMRIVNFEAGCLRAGSDSGPAGRASADFDSLLHDHDHEHEHASNTSGLNTNGRQHTRTAMSRPRLHQSVPVCFFLMFCDNPVPKTSTSSSTVCVHFSPPQRPLHALSSAQDGLPGRDTVIYSVLAPWRRQGCQPGGRGRACRGGGRPGRRGRLGRRVAQGRAGARGSGCRGCDRR